MKRILALMLCLMMAFPALAEETQPGLPLQPCHRFTLREKILKQRNGAEARLWQIETACPDVSGELNALAAAWAEEIAPTLPAPGSTSSRVNVTIHPSRTGLTWMSFMLQARTVVQQQNRDLRFTARTYDMATGERILLRDLFPADSGAWELMADRVQAQIHAYFPGQEPDAALVACAVSRENLEQMDFTLHGMSLVLHLNAADFYPGRCQLIETTLFYPEIRAFMTDKAQQETDNLAYYKTIALTFDDGPNAWCTDQILLRLMQGGERATFFLVGERVKQQAYLVQREHDEGHAVATHNWQHVYANSTPVAQLSAMPAKVDATHTDVIGLPVRYARAPGGQWERMAEAQMGWPLIMWTVDAADWQGTDGPDPKVTARNIVHGASDGGIILMHDLKRNSIQATEQIIAQLQAKGFIFLTVDELFWKDGVALEADKPYWHCRNGKTDR